MPYNNVEIVDVRWWRSEPVRQFIDFLDRSLGIWRHRWGDAPMRGMAISLFAKPGELLHLHEIAYAHPAGVRRASDVFKHMDEEEKLEHLKVSPSHELQFLGMCPPIVDGSKTQIFEPESHDCLGAIGGRFGDGRARLQLTAAGRP